MTIEESIQKDPTKFQSVLEEKVPEIQAAFKDLSAKLDVIFGGAIREYCEKEQVEADMNAIPTYKTMNKLITEKIDDLIKDHIKDKRKDL